MLRVHHAVLKSISQRDDRALPLGQPGKGFADPGQGYAAAHLVLHHIRGRSQEISKGYGIAVAVGAQWLIQADVGLLLAALAQAHEDFILDAPRRVGRKRGTRAHVIAAYGFDQAHRANGDQVVKGTAGHLVLSRDMHDQTHVVLHQHLAGGFVALAHP